MSFCSGLLQDHLVKKLGMQLNPFSFDNHLKITLFFGLNRPKKDRFWQLYFINHVKNSKSSPTANFFLSLKVPCLSTICITRARILGHFLYLTARKLSVCPLSPLLRGENGQKFTCSPFITVLTKSIDFLGKCQHITLDHFHIIRFLISINSHQQQKNEVRHKNFWTIFIPDDGTFYIFKTP